MKIHFSLKIFFLIILVPAASVCAQDIQTVLNTREESENRLTDIVRQGGTIHQAENVKKHTEYQTLQKGKPERIINQAYSDNNLLSAQNVLISINERIAILSAQIESDAAKTYNNRSGKNTFLENDSGKHIQNQKADSKNSEKSNTSLFSMMQELDKLEKAVAKTVNLKKEPLTGKDGENNLSFFGFFDVNSSFLTAESNAFGFGPFELDMEKQLNDRISGGGAFVFEDGAAEVGVGFVDMHFFSETRSPVSPRGRIFTDPGFHLQIGRFDIPFGIDYLFFATPDRETITPPLTTDYVMEGGWNDVGIRLYGTATSFNYTLYLLNGMVGDGYAAGTRIGLFPFRDPFRIHKRNQSKLLELGASFAIDKNENHDSEADFFAFDLESFIEPIQFRAEYIKRRNKIENLDSYGYYATAKLENFILSGYLLAQYDEYSPPAPAGESTDRLKRFLVAVGVPYGNSALIKFEYQNYLDSQFDEEGKNSVFNTTLVISF